MSDRERLIEIIRIGKVKFCDVCDHKESLECDDCENELIAEYLLANGVIVLPCKIGDTVWAIRDNKGIKHPQVGIVSDMHFTKDMSLHIVVKYVARGELGKTVFLTRAEAEAKLREVDHEKD